VIDLLENSLSRIDGLAQQNLRCALVRDAVAHFVWTRAHVRHLTQQHNSMRIASIEESLFFDYSAAPHAIKIHVCCFAKCYCLLQPSVCHASKK
jgi:hypothetical protein